MDRIENKVFPPLAVITAITIISCVYESFINRFSFGALLNIALYILVVMLCYICVLKIYKHYTAAFVAAFFLAIAPNFVNIFSVNPVTFASFILALWSIAVYTLTDSSGLKHNQAKIYFIFSVILYAASLALSSYPVLAPVILLAYEIISKDDVQTASKRLIPFTALALIYIVLKVAGLY
ncbi:hypothetical protein [Endomicrobium proavitum]|uniref:Uncharacterized protein n=1 Tax=Endomicrobium proavitum TaxID=1408281 RepID=A0A0G3WM33_9BACT|nr:hypothetical protein [Endomicrobium proavitum]AKL98519.1 membrane protein of unknown function [Endomicrobium proavitum]